MKGNDPEEYTRIMEWIAVIVSDQAAWMFVSFHDSHLVLESIFYCSVNIKKCAG